MYSLVEVKQWLAENGRTVGRLGRPNRMAQIRHRAKSRSVPTGASRPPARVTDDPPASDQAVGLESVDEDGGLGPPLASDSLALLELKEALTKARKGYWASRREQVKALREEGDLVSREQVIAEHAAMVSRARDRILAVPGAISAELAVAPDARAISKLLEERLRAVLGDLSEGR